MTTAHVNDPELAAFEPAPVTASVRPALHLFGAGLVGGLLTIVGLSVLAVPTTHRCCGASPAQRVQAEQRQRAMQLGVTLEELARMDAVAATSSAAAPAGLGRAAGEE